MADNYVGKLLTELTEKTTATDTDLVPVAAKTGTLFRMTLAKLKEIFLGTKDISGIGDGTVKGAISELNTNMKVLNPSSLQIQSAADGTSTRITLFIYENAGFIEFKTPNGIQKRISLSDSELAIQKYQNGNLLANKVISTF